MFQHGFPEHLQDDVIKVSRLIAKKTYHHAAIDVSQDRVQYVQNNQVIWFPYRMYNVDKSDRIIDQLSLQQKMILHCIYSRSCDGFVRQKHIDLLLQLDYEAWAIPYIVKVCDEYVVEILEMTYEKLKNQDTKQFENFCLENVEAFCKSYNRMISYWNEYYRDRYNQFHHYIGRKLFRECFGYSRSLERRK
ncbi:hypothetical protein H8S33_15295 [Ornithinibacillus sp. BX22]|uniref:Uncharacterized protein n=2 Tax=Ornithinibacillus TaxID=484508 RepID=A0A923L7W9_9BACI|nr:MULTISPECIES: hypothetical protein [Ornithinibacillus]MBC5638160.1 hypothetical protein [Ornithinibacillus hominis]MBS3680768.1 hypothetical protein [Ornithinibacillus massiliensis]